MSTPLNPYQAWLGLPTTGRPQNHYELLGLAPFQTEPPIIHEAVEQQLARLGAHLQGPHAAVARQILAEIQTARDVLLSPPGKKAYDAALRGESPPPAADASASAAPQVSVAAAPLQAVPAHAAAMPAQAVPAQAMPAQAIPAQAMPAQAMPVQAVAAQATPAQAVPVQAAPAAAVPVQAMGAPMMAPPAAAFSSVAPAPAVGRPSTSASLTYLRRRRSSQSQAALVVLGLAVFGLLAVVIYAVMPPSTPPGTQVAVQEEQAAAVPLSDGPRRYVDVAPQRRPAAPAPPNPASLFRGSGLDIDPSTMSPEELARASSGGLMTGPGPAGAAPATPDVGAPAGSAPPATAAPTGPAATMTLPERQPDQRELAAVGRSLAAARAALAARDLSRAEENVELATIEAGSPATARDAARFRNLLAALRDFWAAVREAAKGLSAGDELSVGDVLYTVTEASEEKLVVRSRGRSNDYALDRLPSPLAAALAMRTLPQDEPRTRLLVGAFLRVDQRADAARGQQLLDEAGPDGVELNELLNSLR